MASLTKWCIRSLLCNPRSFSPGIINYKRVHEHAHLIQVLLHYNYYAPRHIYIADMRKKEVSLMYYNWRVIIIEIIITIIIGASTGRAGVR